MMKLKEILSCTSVLLIAFLLTRCSTVVPVPQIRPIHKPYTVSNSFGTFKVTPKKHLNLNENGIASHYGHEFHGKKTAIGTIFNMNAHTAAHKTAHLPCVALVTYRDKTCLVLINDRGPFVKGRILDCSTQLAKTLGFSGKGLANINIKVLPQESLALKENGGNISWDGTTPFPLITNNTKNFIHFAPPKQSSQIVTTKKKKAKQRTIRIIKMKTKKIIKDKNKIRIKSHAA